MVKSNKEYKIYAVRQGTTKTGSHYTVIKIADHYRDRTNSDIGEWQNVYYSVYINDHIEMCQEGTIKFSSIYGVARDDKKIKGKLCKNIIVYVNKDDVVISKEEPKVEEKVETDNPLWDDFIF